MAKAPIGKKRAPATRPTSKAPPSKGSPTPKGGHASAARAAAAAEQRRRNRVLAAGGATAVVVVLIIVLVAVKLAGGSSHSTSGATAVASTPTEASVLATLSGIAPAQLAQQLRAVGGSLATPSSINDPPLTSGGKPEVLYIGAGFCPYCAAERWALVGALLHFGTFTGLNDSASSPIDINPDTPTFSFHGATYTSQYLSFAGVEETTNQPQGTSYARLDTPTAAEETLFEKYTTCFPFIDFGGKFVLKSAQYDGKILAGMTVAQVATQAADPKTDVGTAIEASAGSITATLCHLTGAQPASVCSAFTGA